MAITAETLIAPSGPVEPELFPGEVTGDDRSKLLVRVNTYVNKGVVKATAAGFTDPSDLFDAAVEAWALYLAFDAAYTLYVMRPAEEDTQMVLLGRNRYDNDQRNALADKAMHYKELYMSLEATLGDSTPSSTGIPSFQSRNTYDW